MTNSSQKIKVLRYLSDKSNEFSFKGSGLTDHQLSSDKPLKYTHLDVAGSHGRYPDHPTASSVVALSMHFLWQEDRAISRTGAIGFPPPTNFGSKVLYIQHVLLLVSIFSVNILSFDGVINLNLLPWTT